MHGVIRYRVEGTLWDNDHTRKEITFPIHLYALCIKTVYTIGITELLRNTHTWN